MQQKQCRGDFIAKNTYIKKSEKSQVKKSLHHKELVKQKQLKYKVNKRKEFIKIRVEINEVETRKTVKQMNKTKSWSFRKINKTDKYLTRLTEKQRGVKQQQ